jgi:hypothetical protein
MLRCNSMRLAVVWLVLALGLRVAAADSATGVVVIGDEALGKGLSQHVHAWLDQHGHAVSDNPLDADGIATIANCLQVDNLVCASGVIEHRSMTEDIVFVNVRKGKTIGVDVYWFVKGHEPLAERRACEDCSPDALASTVDSMMDALAQSQTANNGRVTIGSDPSGLTVVIDQIVVGVTPVVRDLATGKHDIVLMKGSQRVGQRTLVLHAGEEADVKIPAHITQPRSKLPGALVLGLGVTAVGVAGAMYALSPTDDGTRYHYSDYRPPAIGIGIGGGVAIIVGALLLVHERHSESLPVVAIDPHGGGYIGWVHAL